MKVLLYFENEKIMKKSGIGRALCHQRKALSLNNIEYTTNRNDDFDVAHVNTYYKKSLKLVKYCKENNIPVIVHGHSTKEDFKNSFKFWQLMQPSIYRRIERTYSKPDLIITPTNYSKKLIENYDFVKCPVVAISNGIDLKQYSVTVTAEDEKLIRTKYNLKDDEKFVIGIGWLFERKGIQDFIEIARRFPNIRFIWFGQKTSILYTNKIVQAIKNKPANVMLPGYIPQDDIVKMLHLSSCFLFPSYEETEGIVLLEALATKTPVLIRDIEVFDYLTNEVDCLKANTNEEFCNKLDYILNHDCSEMIEKGYKIVEKRDLKYVGEQLKKEYDKLLNDKKN